ncbi:hypothetical protein LCGC14_0349800 [marine sediment metagenome]|uniref:Uncharacterized protein n=1 Tax=marine sediment metagenome TaxID=412755 RepID=A0A0F9WJ36_9ZZZZ
MTEKNTVIEEQTLEGDTSPPAVETEGEEKATLTEERVQELIAEATAKAVLDAKEVGRRELQRQQESNRLEKQSRQRAESDVRAYETSFKGLDEEVQKDIELARFREQDKYNRSTMQEETQKQQTDAFYQRMNDGVFSHLESLGILRDDKRLDWGEGSRDYVEARNKLDASVAKILNSDREDKEKTLVGKAEERFKQLETEFRKEHNLDSHDTSGGAGVVNQSDADFMAGMGDASLSLTKENRARLKQIQAKY